MWFWAKKKGSGGPVGKPFVSRTKMRTMEDVREVKEKGEEEDVQRLISGNTSSLENEKAMGMGKEIGMLGLEGYIARMEKANDIVLDSVAERKDANVEDPPQDLIVRPANVIPTEDVPRMLQPRPKLALKTSSSRVFAWSTLPHAVLPPLMLDRPGALLRSPHPAHAMRSPFPRYGHALAPTQTADGEFILFGGLVEESVLRNDVYAIRPTPARMEIRRVQTTGDIPPPRTGSKSALRGNVLIVWGGDTRQDASLKDDAFVEDSGVYLLNLGSRTWTRIKVSGETPEGRCGHIMALLDTRLFIFGGRAGETFLGDLWALDLLSLKSSPQWEHLKPPPDRQDFPEPRTGHTCVVYQDTIMIFGGQDDKYHYNDTWALNTSTMQWSELTCIGYTPAPREGHSATIIGDMMYIYGGRGVDGRDLGDIASLRLTGASLSS
ncbi:hypothetical protein D9619_002392 [Psilocybe cf. subviscida]|uniref:Galactose oxidase n=1 Tax=Psilocybe cf. subviscida TaxID=2480587 RepID=A0A8H5AWK2_9AGAR|nr:hypothetical protein D9619_002392 [Psilocybe cf. subviscida]